MSTPASKLTSAIIKQSLFLYRRIWKCHRICLAGEARKFGNDYVREEFKVHLQRATPEQFTTFIQSWERYATFMEKSRLRAVDKSRDMKTTEPPKELNERLNENQKKVLDAFKEAIYALKKNQKNKRDGTI